ncbi:MAG: hypothetical protein V3R65_00605 [Acidiferrobacterales bacterium]
MLDAKVYEEWRGLCNEREAAGNAKFKACNVVNQKYKAIVQGTSQANPTDDERSECEKAEQILKAIDNKISEFLEKNS